MLFIFYIVWGIIMEELQIAFDIAGFQEYFIKHKLVKYEGELAIFPTDIAKVSFNIILSEEEIDYYFDKIYTKFKDELLYYQKMYKAAGNVAIILRKPPKPVMNPDVPHFTIELLINDFAASSTLGFFLI